MLAEDLGVSILDRDLAQTARDVFQPDPEGVAEGGRQFGPYVIDRLIGEGGMGVVYLGRRPDLGSQAAIKVLRDAWLSPARQARFAAEQRTLARLAHDSIARLYDAGSLPDGTPWIAMEYVEGSPFTTHCRDSGASMEERLRLFAAVCRAVQHAHQHLIIHRDLKPSNILVTPDGAIKLLDFGIAKQLEAGGPGEGQTRTALRLLTPAYAAPEQLRGEPVGVYTDTYSLGVVLYELLADRPPFELSRRTPGEVEASILAEEPVRPSLPGTKSPHGRGLSRAAWADLDVLCLTAMNKDPSRRYPTVADLARDVERYLAGEPLLARPDTAGYRLRKFVRRNRVPVAAVSVVLSLVVGLVGFYTTRLRSARNQAEAEATKAQRIQRFTLNLFQGGDRETGPSDTIRVVTLVERGLLEARALSAEPGVQAEMFETLGSIYGKLGNLARGESLLIQALEQRRAREPRGGPEVTRSLVALGLLRAEQARFDDAEGLIREAVAMGRGALGSDHPARAEATVALAQVLIGRGRYDDAAGAAAEAAASRPAGTAEQAEALGLLADAHFYAGHYEISDSINQLVLEQYRRLYGETHPLVAQRYINLGAVQQERGNYSEAEKFHRQGLAVIRRFYGEDHHETAYALTMVARAMIFQNKSDDADSLLRRALAVRERVYGPNHPSVASSVNELGNLAISQDRLDEAEGYFSRMVAIYRSVYRENHYLIGIAEANLGTVYMRRQENARAEQLFRSALGAYSGTLEPGHVNVGITRIKLGRVLLRQGRFAEAATESQAGYDILVRQANPAVSFLRAARTDLAAAYDSLRQPEKAARFKAELAESK